MGVVTRRLYDAEGDGWDPARQLSLVAGQRELGSADSVAEVLSWRIDGYLAEHPSPPVRDGFSLEDETAARERLAAAAGSVLGLRLSSHAQQEKAWPALIAALRRAEDADFDASELLAAVARPAGLRGGRSVSEVLAWRISRYLAAHPADADREADDTQAGSLSTVPLSHAFSGAGLRRAETVRLLAWFSAGSVTSPWLAGSAASYRSASVAGRVRLAVWQVR
jgi:hypothetical protein